MKNMMLALLAAAAMATAGAASAEEICKAHDKANWMTKDEITSRVTAMGYQVRKVQEEDGCWEVKGTRNGKRVEAYFDPVSAELVLVK